MTQKMTNMATITAEDDAFYSITKVGVVLPAELSLLKRKSGETVQLKTFCMAKTLWQQEKRAAGTETASKDAQG